MNACTTYTLACLVSKVIQYLQIGIMLIISLAVVTFVWNIYRYFFKADVENKKEAGMYVLYSTIGFFIILSFWGLVAIISNTLNLPSSGAPWPFGGGATYQTPNTIFSPNKGTLPSASNNGNSGNTIPDTSNTGYETIIDSFGNPHQMKIDNNGDTGDNFPNF